MYNTIEGEYVIDSHFRDVWYFHVQFQVLGFKSKDPKFDKIRWKQKEFQNVIFSFSSSSSSFLKTEEKEKNVGTTFLVKKNLFHSIWKGYIKLKPK